MIVREPNPKPASEAQIDFLDKLLIESGRSTRGLRNGWLSSRAGREIKYMDELSMREASAMIEELKEEFNQNQEYE